MSEANPQDCDGSDPTFENLDEFGIAFGVLIGVMFHGNYAVNEA
jgi:hypothetical protein